jgi:hypothetical protein
MAEPGVRGVKRAKTMAESVGGRRIPRTEPHGRR